MSSCELCGTDVESLIKTKISGAELDVCPNCTQHGEPLDLGGSEESEPSTKYSTNSSSSSTTTQTDSSSNQSSSPSPSHYPAEDDEQNSFEEVHDLALNYGDVIQDARNANGYNRAELADELGIKQSHLKNIEDETTQPSVKLQGRLERKLDIDLSAQDIDYDG